jgi:hypothetical protein
MGTPFYISDYTPGAVSSGHSPIIMPVEFLYHIFDKFRASSVKILESTGGKPQRSISYNAINGDNLNNWRFEIEN